MKGCMRDYGTFPPQLPKGLGVAASVRCGNALGGVPSRGRVCH